MKMNIEFMDEKSCFHAKVEDDLEKEIYEIIKGGTEYFEQQEKKDISIEAFEQTSIWRSALLDWYPFKKNSKILEIGAGVGALTGVLANNAEQLVSIEKKASRCDIIKERYQSRTNVVVHNINFFYYQENEKYDYIVFHEIFGYIKKYCNESKPYIAVLKKLKNLLKKNGVLLIATENRLGLKYFSGSIEDYSCRLFGGLNNFDGFDLIKTFTKSEYIDLLNQVGYEKFRFYYPFPDCTFPTEVFTDDILNDIYYGGSINETNSEKLELFNEQRMFRDLQNEGIVTKFANAFLIEISDAPINDNFLYSYLDDKADFGKHHTIIYHDTTEGKILESYQDGKLCKKNLVSKQQRLDQFIIQKLNLIDNDLGDKKQIVQSIYDCFVEQVDLLRKVTLSNTNFDKDKFIKLFGEEIELSKNTVLIDRFILVKDIYIGESNKIVSDIPIGANIPIGFAEWNLIENWYFEYIFGNSNYEKLIDVNVLYEKCNITPDEVIDYRRWMGYYNQKNQCLNKYFKDKYKCNYIYTADICEKGTPIRSLDNNDNEKDINKLKVLEEKKLLDLLRK